MLVLIEDGKAYFDKDPDRFYGEVELLLNPIVDFKTFARSVMGRYGSKRYYTQLDDAGKKAYREQFGRFVDTFKSGLIQTYGKGLLALDGNKMELQPANAADLQAIAEGKSVEVVQLYHTSSAEQPYVIRYKMRPSRDKSTWQLRNVTIESINIGQVYRSQFEAAMQKYNEDIALVVDNWTVQSDSFEKAVGQTASAAAGQ
jgi:phospholipid transport system substrate-binding protein